MISIALILGAPVTEPQGKIARIMSTGPSPSSISAVTVEVI